MKEIKRGKYRANGKARNVAQLPKTRKDVRKARRKLKKLIKSKHVMKVKQSKLKPQFPGRFVRAPTPEIKDEDAFSKTLVTKESLKSKKKVIKFMNVIEEERNEEKKQQIKLVNDIQNKRKELLLKANEEEELIIKRLEKQLGMKKMKSKNKTKSFAGDGLDYLLEICDRTALEQSAAVEKYLNEIENNSDFNEDIAIATGQEIKMQKKSKQNRKSKSISEDENDSDLQSNYGLSENNEELYHSDLEENLNNVSDSDHESEDNYYGDESMMERELSADDEKKSDSVLENDEDDLTEIYSNKTGSPKKRLNVSEDHSYSKKKVRLTEKENMHKKDENVFKKCLIDDLLQSDSDDEKEELLEVERHDNISENDANGTWEDIYGRKRDKDGNVLKEKNTKYIPPHMRKQTENNDTKEIIQLKRQMKSILNKLAIGNMHWACSQIENLYNCNSRNAVNSSLCDLWLSAIVQSTVSPDRMVAEHAMLIAVLQANVGMEVGAHFLQTLVKKFDSGLNDSEHSEDKSLENLMSGLSYLYSFKIYHASLLFEMLSKLTEEITEKHIECILISLRTVGALLRKDEPLLLKSFIHETQAKTSQLSEKTTSGTRVKFLMDVLLAIKNNNLTKIPNYDPSYSEELKKAMKGIIRRGNYVTPLNIKMDDLLKVDEQGKWWVVGSAWNGTLGNSDKNKLEEGSKSSFNTNKLSKKLLELARQQRMNTEARKTIFCIIMSAEDFMDAFEKLLHLGFKNQQERDIVYVLIACCLQEKNYNPFYAVLAQKFCEYDRKFQLSIQYAVWDKLKDINNFTSTHLVNLAQFLTHLFLEKGLPLSVLKVIHFSELNKRTLRLMRQILLAILLADCQETCLEVFQRVALSTKLHMYRESLRLFIRHFLLKNLTDKDSDMDSEKRSLLEQRASVVDKVLATTESKVRF